MTDYIPYRSYEIDPITFKVYKDGHQEFTLRYFHSVAVAKSVIDDHLRAEAFAKLPNLNYSLPALDYDEQRERDEIALQEWYSNEAERQLEDGML